MSSQAVNAEPVRVSIARFDAEAYRAEAIARATVEHDRLRAQADSTNRKLQQSLDAALIGALAGMTVESDFSSAVYGLAFVGLGVFMVSARRDYKTGEVSIAQRWYGIGDAAVWGGMNVYYTGTIAAVTAKRISIARRGYAAKKSLDMSTFLSWNKQTMDEVRAENQENGKYI